jgi:hypothetical protein
MGIGLGERTDDRQVARVGGGAIVDRERWRVCRMNVEYKYQRGYVGMMTYAGITIAVNE